MQRDAFCTWLFARSLRRCAASETTNVIWEMEAICWHQSLAAGIAVNRDINPAPVVMGGGYEGSFITQIGAIHWCVTNQLVCWEKLSSAWHKTSNALNLDSFYTFHCFLSSSCLSYIRSLSPDVWPIWTTIVRKGDFLEEKKTEFSTQRFSWWTENLLALFWHSLGAFFIHITMHIG